MLPIIALFQKFSDIQVPVLGVRHSGTVLLRKEAVVWLRAGQGSRLPVWHTVTFVAMVVVVVEKAFTLLYGEFSQHDYTKFY